jgi:hypothetical protein
MGEKVVVRPTPVLDTTTSFGIRDDPVGGGREVIAGGELAKGRIDPNCRASRRWKAGFQHTTILDE